MQNRPLHRRILFLWVCSLLVLLCFVVRLGYLQLVKGEEYALRAKGTVSYNFPIDAIRGRIFDRNGIELASSETSYNVELNNLMLGDADLNETIYQLLVLLQEQGLSWSDSLPINHPQSGESYELVDSSDNAELIAKLKADLNLQQYATADQIMMQLVARYELESYPAEWQRALAGVRREMELEGFSDSQCFTLSRDIPVEAYTALTEGCCNMDGVELLETAHRTYIDGTIASPILGSVGSISAEDWMADGYAMADQGYQLDDQVGISGMEALYESELRGEDGILTITRTSDGTVLSRETTSQPVPGTSLVLTLDATIQRRTADLLAAHIQMLQATKAVGKGREACAGSVVVLDTETGGVLAAVSYPSYDLNDYTANYQTYAEDANRPLFNRALSGLYAPGSAFKPTVALAGLISGIITPTDTVDCTGTYTYYSDYQPGCLQISHSGPVDLETALKYSCNIYFYDLGRRLGLNRINSMAQKLGLGTDTGVELAEAQGSLTNPEDSNYSDGLVLQASIGQAGNAFTPMQLATYACTLANQGVRTRTHLVEGFYDEQTGEFSGPTSAEVVDVVADSVDAFPLVQQGMVDMAGTLSDLAALPYEIACKTGSPQLSETYDGVNHYTNTIMIAYGPVPDPKIAVAIVIENGGGGANGAALLADIMQLCLPDYDYGAQTLTQ